MKNYHKEKYSVTDKGTARSIQLVVMLLLVLAASCSKDHDDPDPTPEPEPVVQDLSRLTAVLTTPKGTAVWTDGDSLKMFSVSTIQQLSYHLTAGAGTEKGLFEPKSSSELFDRLSNLYVMTANKYVYSISATEMAIPMLAERIPNEYSLEEIHALPGTFRMPTPFWGKASISADGTPTLEMCGLTALLSIDLSRLPQGTHAIVLTTHNGFLLNKEQVNGCGGEMISGTFDTVLNDGATLKENRIFINGDSLRVSFFSERDIWNEPNWTPPVLTGKIFLPVIVNTYKQLHVIAVTGDDYDPYYWEGTELQVFKNKQFTLNSLVEL